MVLEDKKAIVTGGGRGLGRGIALALADAGCDVAVTARTAGEVEETAEMVRGRGRAALALTCDVTDPGDVERMAADTLSAFGRIDLLVNNAGYACFERLENLPLEEWRRTLDVNLTGPFLCAKAVIPAMKAQGGGRIINISSMAGLKPYVEQGAYCASKYGLNGLSGVLAAELQDCGIAVHALCPGAVPTKLSSAAMPERDTSEWMTPEDVAQACLYLATLSPRAAVDILPLRRFASNP